MIELATERHKHKNCIVMGNFNGHIGSFIEGHKGVHRSFGWIERNSRKNALEFAAGCGMIVGNTYFQKGVEKLITSKLVEMQLCWIIFCLQRKC